MRHKSCWLPNQGHLYTLSCLDLSAHLQQFVRNEQDSGTLFANQCGRANKETMQCRLLSCFSGFARVYSLSLDLKKNTGMCVCPCHEPVPLYVGAHSSHQWSKTKEKIWKAATEWMNLLLNFLKKAKA